MKKFIKNNWVNIKTAFYTALLVIISITIFTGVYLAGLFVAGIALVVILFILIKEKLS